MTDRLYAGDRIYGPPGLLTFIPLEDDDDGPPKLHSSRITTQVPQHKIVEPLGIWYPSPRSIGPGPVPHSWASKRQQARWLFKTHPEAFMGNPEVGSLLLEGIMDFNQADTGSNRLPLLAIGQMMDVSIPSQVAASPILAMATGESAELLRLVRLNNTNWQWNGHESPSLRLFGVDQDDKEEMAMWSSDGLPILQIKFCLSLTRHEPTRWLLVQKKASTTILQPEYHRIPVSRQSSGIDRLAGRPSRIDPKPLLTISRGQTGGNAHADVSFNPGSHKRPPQLAIIDECGYWSVWNILGREHVATSGIRAALHKCGHIQDGTLLDLPTETAFNADHHGLLWVGSSHGRASGLGGVPYSPSDKSESFGVQSSLGALTSRSSTLLLWSRTKFELVDLGDPDVRQSLPILKPNQLEWILDVQMNPVSQTQVFLLTNLRLFWIETASSSRAADQEARLSVLLSCQHLRESGDENLRLMAYHGGYSLGDKYCLLHLYSEQSPQVDIFWFSVSEETELPQFHHKIVQGAFPQVLPNMQTLRMAPANLSGPSSAAPSGPGAAYLDRNVSFHQLFALGKDLSVAYSLFATFSGGDLEIVPPDNSINWSEEHKTRIWNRRRFRFLQHVENAFVVPDGLTDMDGLVQPGPLDVHGPSRRRGGERIQQRWPRPLNINLLLSRIDISLESVAMAVRHKEPNATIHVFEVLREAIGTAIEEGHLTLKSLREHGATFEAPPMSEQEYSDWDSQLSGLLGVPERRIVTQAVIAEYFGMRMDTNTPLSDFRSRLLNLWETSSLPPHFRLSRQLVISETSEAAVKSLYAVSVLDHSNLGPPDLPATWVPLSQASAAAPKAESSQKLSRSPSPGSSQTSAGPSQSFQISGTSTAKDEKATAALHRLSLLAPQLNTSKKGSVAQHTIMSYWPEQRGGDTEGYVSSVLEASGKHLEEIRERRERAESRRRQRAVRLGLPKKAEPEEPSTQPLPKTLASSSQVQPGSSQSHILPSSQLPPSQIMSQPTAGAHGRRQQKKSRGKRKGGF